MAAATAVSDLQDALDSSTCKELITSLGHQRAS